MDLVCTLCANKFHYSIYTSLDLKSETRYNHNTGVNCKLDFNLQRMKGESYVTWFEWKMNHMFVIILDSMVERFWCRIAALKKIDSMSERFWYRIAALKKIQEPSSNRLLVLCQLFREKHRFSLRLFDPKKLDLKVLWFWIFLKLKQQDFQSFNNRHQRLIKQTQVTAQHWYEEA